MSEVPVALKTDLPEAPVSAEEARQAAQELGLTYFSPEKARKFKVIGKHLSQLGIIELGVGRIAASDEALTRMMQTAVDISESNEFDPGARVAALTAGRGLAEAIMRSVELMRDLLEDKLIQGPTIRRRSFVDDKPVVPIQAQQVTINLADTSKTPQTS